RNILRRDRGDRQAVGSAVMFPFTAEDDLEMRHSKAADFPADAVETQIGDMVLAAAIEAAADLDMEMLHGFIELEAFLGQAFVKLAGQSARGRNAQLAGIRARAGDDVNDRARSRIAPPDGIER